MWTNTYTFILMTIFVENLTEIIRQVKLMYIFTYLINIMYAKSYTFSSIPLKILNYSLFRKNYF